MREVTVVKLDICRSRQFAAARESSNPTIRSRALEVLMEIASNCFPQPEQGYPDGSFYKADGDAIYFVVEKPSVALRGAIEFMQSWYHKGLTDYPECRVFLDKGPIDVVRIADRNELTGRPFEHIAMFEKGRGEGNIYLTRQVLDAVDLTMAKFRHEDSIRNASGDEIRVYIVDFLNPRTLDDSSLIHALFIAHPKAAQARERLFEIFLLEFLVERRTISNLEEFTAWARQKGYSLPEPSALSAIISSSTYVTESADGEYRLSDRASEVLQGAREEFAQARVLCHRSIAETILEETGRADALEGVDLSAMVDDYLCGVFAEIRMIANYFRSTLHLFDAGPGQFSRFDYLIRRRLPEQHHKYFEDWRRGLLRGLLKSTQGENIYIASVFHNVLATYYLNRSSQASAYQIDTLRRRVLFLDTNVLYSLQVPASEFHAVTKYFVDRLNALGIKARIAAITLREYEESLAFVERNWDSTGPKPILVTRNPWLFQEYMSNPGRYLSSIAVCRQTYSLAREIPVQPENFDALSPRVGSAGLELERSWQELSQPEAEALWMELRNAMTSSKWSIERYWEFIYKDFPPEVKRHDMTCIRCLSSTAEAMTEDELGSRLLFVTLDSKLLRLRKRFQFIVTPDQLLEYFLPYLFLSDIPVEDADTFPNTLLSAQLGTLLVKRPPEIVDIVGAYLGYPELGKADAAKTFRDVSPGIAKALNNQRFRDLVSKSEKLGLEEHRELVPEVAAALQGLIDGDRETRQRSLEMDRLRRELREKESLIEKLHKTVRYWRSQGRGKRP